VHVTELPLACTLDAAELSRRVAEIAAVGKASLLAAEVEGGRAVLSFEAEARERLAAIVAAEAECCPFLQMTLDARAETVQLAIEAPAGGEPIVRDLVAAFGGGAPA
jgi:hypothetical protein